MTGQLGEIINNVRGFQGIAALKQDMDAKTEQKKKQDLAIESLNKYRSSVQAGAPDQESLTTAVINSPELAQNVLNSIGIVDKQKAQDAASFALGAYKVADDPNQFLNLAANRVDFLQKSGRDPKDTIALIQQYQSGDKEGAKRALQGVAASLVGAGHLPANDYKTIFSSGQGGGLTEYQKQSLDLQRERLNKTPSAVQGTSNQRDWETYQGLLKNDPEQARRFGIAAGFESPEGQKLSSFSEKQISDAGNEYTESTSAAGRYSSLAQQIRPLKLSGGVAASWGEKLKEFTGDQDAITKLRKDVLGIVNSEAIKSLPPGPATDRDIELVRAPFPTDKANGAYVANWLEAVARLNQKKAEFAEHKADFIAANGGQRSRNGETVLSTWKKKQKESETVTAPAEEAPQNAPKITSKYKIEVVE